MSCGDFDVVTGESFTALLRKRPVVIALYAPTSQSGKTEAAKALNEIGFETVKFAGPLKTMVRGLFRSMGISEARVERMVEGDLKEAVVPGFTTATPRHIMQTLGTDWGREAVEEDLWTNVCIERCRALTARGKSVVVDDMRFPNELRGMQSIGATLVRIFRPGFVAPAGARYEGLLEAERFNYTIINDDSLDGLRRCALSIADSVRMG
jgi:hypothetical protein